MFIFLCSFSSLSIKYMHYDITCMHSSGYTAFFMSHTILQILRVLMVFKIIILWLHSTLWTDNLLRHIPIAAPAAGLILFFCYPRGTKTNCIVHNLFLYISAIFWGWISRTEIIGTKSRNFQKVSNAYYPFLNPRWSWALFFMFVY